MLEGFTLLRLCLFIISGCFSSWVLSQEAQSHDITNQKYNNDFDWEENVVLEQSLPMVLTAARLRQPKAEVSSSVTVITAEKIKLWGVRTLPELMKFVPGMFVGHADDDNNASVAYHTSNPNVMRRLQVLIDGRSVYKPAIATVIWDDIGLSLEDIERIEVIRGPNAAVYGANSYLGVINILTKHPEDSLGTQVSWRKGNKGTQDVHFRHGLSFESTSVRISGSVKADEGFDGRESTGSDVLRDGRKHGFINAYINHQIDETSQVDLQFGYKSGKTEMRQIDFYTSPPDKLTTNGYAYGRWQKEFSNLHQSHLQFYWQKEERKQNSSVCGPSLVFDSNMIALNNNNPKWASIFSGIPALYGDPNIQAVVNNLKNGNVYTPQNVMDIVKQATNRDVVITSQDLVLTKQVLDGIPDLSSNFPEITCGYTGVDLTEQRVDVEWQDTFRWSDQLRTVSGISYRQDSANSQTYFNGEVSNSTWRAFLNTEYLVNEGLILNAGGMYEHETDNEAFFSPKISANVILDPQQSIRLVVSQAVRTPDLLESNPEFVVNVQGLSDNYLGQTNADFYQQNIAERDEDSLSPEKITSYEIGYYIAGNFANMNAELDIKLFREEMRDLISDAMTLENNHISNDNEADVDGVEMQLSNAINENHSIWMTYSYLEVDSRYVGDRLTEDEIERVELLENRLSSTHSTVISWLYNSESWSASLSYFNQDRSQIDSPYERIQLNIAKPFTIAGLNAEMSYYVQHNRNPDSPLIYSNQIYSTPNIYYAQLALDF